MGDFIEYAQNNIQQGVNTGLGMLLGEWNDARQIRQQRRLQNLQMQGQKEMGIFNREQALKQWEDTNYSAQVRELRKAGLNVGLMYEGGGAGGTTQGAGAGNVTGGSAPVGGGEVGMAIQLGQAQALQQAQIENINATTAKIKAETPREGQTIESLQATIDNLKQITKNAKVTNSILEFEKKIKEVESNVAGLTQPQQIEAINEALKKLKADAEIAEDQKEITEATKNDVIKGAVLANDAVKAGIAGTKASTKQTEQNIQNLEATEEGQIMANIMRANGIEPGDSPSLRIALKWLQENDISMKSLTKKTKAIGAWLRGQNGSQTMERLREIMNE